jgi:hypothetical protein
MRARGFLDRPDLAQFGHGTVVELARAVALEYPLHLSRVEEGAFRGEELDGVPVDRVVAGRDGDSSACAQVFGHQADGRGGDNAQVEHFASRRQTGGQHAMAHHFARGTGIAAEHYFLRFKCRGKRRGKLQVFFRDQGIADRTANACD